MSSKVLLGFLAGAAAGALTGILLAPDKGSATRKKIAGKAGDITDSVKNSFNEFIDGIKNAYSSVKEETEELKEQAAAKMSAAKKEMKNSFS